MKKMLVAVTIMLVSGSFIFAQEQQSEKPLNFDALKKPHKPDFETQDEKDVRRAVQQYYGGVVTANIERVKEAWAMKSGHVKYVDQDDDKKDIVKTVPISLASKSWTQAPADRASANVLMLDIVANKMAMVKLEFVYNDNTFMDYLTLYKLNGKWKIVLKAYTFVQ